MDIPFTRCPISFETRANMISKRHMCSSLDPAEWCKLAKSQIAATIQTVGLISKFYLGSCNSFENCHVILPVKPCKPHNYQGSNKERGIEFLSLKNGAPSNLPRWLVLWGKNRDKMNLG